MWVSIVCGVTVGSVGDGLSPINTLSDGVPVALLFEERLARFKTMPKVSAIANALTTMTATTNSLCRSRRRVTLLAPSLEPINKRSTDIRLAKVDNAQARPPYALQGDLQ